MVKFKYRDSTFYFTKTGPDTVDKTIESGRFYEQEMLQYLEKFDFRGSTIVDVGAYIGNHSVYLSSFTNCKEVLAFEPNPVTYSILVKNIKENKLESKVKAFNAALGGKAGKVSVQQGAGGKLGGSRVISGDEIEVKTLDSIAKNKNISLIKIDVEGYESNVLTGAKNTLKKQAPLLTVEAATWRAKIKLDKILLPLGYRAARVFNRTDTYLYVKGKGSHQFSGVFADLSLIIEKLARSLRRNRYVGKIVNLAAFLFTYLRNARRPL